MTLTVAATARSESEAKIVEAATNKEIAHLLAQFQPLVDRRKRKEVALRSEFAPRMGDGIAGAIRRARRGALFVGLSRPALLRVLKKAVPTTITSSAAGCMNIFDFCSLFTGASL